MLFYCETGFKAFEQLYEAGRIARTTVWNRNGTVKRQTEVKFDGQIPSVGHRGSPPWWWGVTDQTEPTAPWWNEKDQ